MTKYVSVHSQGRIFTLYLVTCINNVTHTKSVSGHIDNRVSFVFICIFLCPNFILETISGAYWGHPDTLWDTDQSWSVARRVSQSACPHPRLTLQGTLLHPKLSHFYYKLCPIRPWKIYPGKVCLVRAAGLNSGRITYAIFCSIVVWYMWDYVISVLKNVLDVIVTAKETLQLLQFSSWYALIEKILK